MSCELCTHWLANTVPATKKLEDSNVERSLAVFCIELVDLMRITTPRNLQIGIRIIMNQCKT